MNRKQFIKKGLLTTGAIAVAGGLTAAEKNEAKAVVGFNHIPNPTSKSMSNMVLHPAESRGHANLGWLNTYHSFSFAHYYNPERMHFGALRVLNDDWIAPGMGFSRHPHDNMEIISIPLSGDLEHQDSMGNTQVIRQGDIQVMSAGSGIQHSEKNKNHDKATELLQIWVIPNKRNVTPRYDQISLNLKDRENKLQQILSPNPDDEGVWIHQDAWFHIGRFDAGKEEVYIPKKSSNGVYAFIINGLFKVNEQEVKHRDAVGLWDVDSIRFTSQADHAEILLLEVPLIS